MKIFDYIYYRVYHIYKVKWKDGTPGAFATSLVTLLQCLYIVVIPGFIYELIYSTKLNLLKEYIIVALVILFIFNLYRYNKVHNYESLSKKWNDEDKLIKKRRGVYIISFIIITIVICLTLAVLLSRRDFI